MNNKKSNNTWLIVVLAVFIPLILLIGLVCVIIFTAVILRVSTNTNIEYKGEYVTRKTGFTNHLSTSYADYSKYFGDKTRSDFEKYDYYIFEVGYNGCSEKNIKPEKPVFDDDDNTVTIKVTYTRSCDYCELEYRYYVLGVPKGKYNTSSFYIDYEARNNVKCGPIYYEDKPMIYIYPEEDTYVNIKLGNPDKLTVSYPKYNNEWNVLAKKDGTLLSNGREYYGLYWEGVKKSELDMSQGFVVKGEDTVKFLEEKLEILGLNDREINEFIVYWLPKMEKNNYNFIRFSTREEIDEYMPIYFTPSPETFIRINMEFKPLSDILMVEEQNLEKEYRKGFTVVEWGGTMYE